MLRRVFELEPALQKEVLSPGKPRKSAPKPSPALGLPTPGGADIMNIRPWIKCLIYRSDVLFVNSTHE